MKRLERDPERLESLNLFRQVEARTGGGDAEPLASPERVERFVDIVKQGLAKAFSSASTLHGWLTQELFLAVVVTLGSARLVQQLDAGETHYAGKKPKVPDFLVVSGEGERLLVEVKGNPRDPLRGYSLSSGEVRGLRRYADLAGGRLLVAVYWVQLGMWSLTTLSAFRRRGERYHMSLEGAMKRNELGMLGDLMLGTPAPLTMRLLAGSGAVEQSGPEPGTSQVEFTIAGVELRSEDRVLNDEQERGIAFSLMMYGRWSVERLVYRRDGRFAGLEFVAAPEVKASDEGHPQRFDIVGSLSEIFSRQFLAATTDEDVPHRLSAELDPGALSRVLKTDYESRELPLWRFSLEPAEDGR